jgi:molybdopterin converting factor small subunit
MSIRWDAVVDRKAASHDAPAPPPRRPAGAAHLGADRVRARVRLFGALASISRQSMLEFEFRPGDSVGDVVARLGEQLGEAVLSHLLDQSGAKRRHCRLFVDGYPVEDLRSALAPTANPTEIDIILLVAPEGG